MDAIEVSDLTRIYRSATGIIRRQYKEVLAVDKVSFSVAPGELFGLLGPNGAGKTTIVKILTTLLLPTAGEVCVLGEDVVRRPERLRARIGFIFGGERGLYWRLSATDNLRYFASLYHMEPAVSRPRIVELLEMVGLSDRRARKLRDTRAA